MATKKFPRGHKMPPAHVSAARHRVSNAKYGAHLRALPVATQSSYDAYAAPGGSCVPPILNQGPCGDCYIFSGTKVCSAAQMTAGVAPPGSGFCLSEQWALDYHPELGGCNGGDEYQVAQTIQSDGAPSATEYPGAGQNPGTPLPTTGMTLYTVSGLIYCDPTQTNQGVASTQSIKNCILAYGYVSVAVAAGDDWDNYQPGQTLTGAPDPNGINHAVGATGWDDNHDNGDGTKGAWLLDNQWDTSWGNNGRGWIKYGAESFGTEAFIATATAPTPSPTPTPAPPVPGPPVPGPTPVPPTPAPVVPQQVVIPAQQIQVPHGFFGSTAVTVPGQTVPVTPVTSAFPTAPGPVLALIIQYAAIAIPIVLTDLAAGKSWAAIGQDIIAALFPVATKRPCGKCN